ncbi:hypothetical protein ACWEV3_40905 [Saccharopolyspora sp. NPDC003752]
MSRYAPIVRYTNRGALVDRATLARLLGRSVHTIRAACTVVDRDKDGRPLYDAKTCAEQLAKVATRNRQPKLTAVG